MSPRSLLFCSNRETSQLLAGFLRQLQFEVEHCPEIFDAVKRLTSHSHEVIVIDWDEGLEAGFLLKTARELKSNRDAFVIAVAKADAVAAVWQAGANEVVIKPPLSEIKNGLVSSRDFLAGLERRFDPPQKAAKPSAVVHVAPRAPVQAARRVAAPAKVLQLPVPASSHHVAASTPAPTLTFATFDDGLLSNSRLRQVFTFIGADLVSLLKVNGRRNALLRLAAMVVAFFTVGYVSSQPLSKIGDSMAEIYQEVWGITPNSHPSPRPEPHQSAELVQASFSEPAESLSRSSLKIQVTPLSNDSPRQEKAAGGVREAIETALPPDEQPMMANATTGLHIPKSLTSQFPGAGTVRNVAERISPAILGSFEPVNLPGYLSEKLLLDRVEPSYPEQALRAGLQGPVVLQAWIGRDGKIRDLKLIRGPLLLGQAAYQAVKRWRYQPYLLNGEAVEAQTYVTLDFKLP
jgi:TonB family protein